MDKIRCDWDAFDDGAYEDILPSTAEIHHCAVSSPKLKVNVPLDACLLMCGVRIQNCLSQTSGLVVLVPASTDSLHTC